MALRTIHLHGIFNDLQPTPFEMDVDTPMMLLLALQSQIKGFKEAFRQTKFISFVKDEICITEDTFKMPFGNAKEIHLVPAVEGSGADPITWTVIGTWVAHTLVALATTYAVMSIANELAPKPDTSKGAGPQAQLPSFLFSGAVNTNTPGVPVPIVYGKFRTGSVVISVGTDSERIIQPPPPSGLQIDGTFIDPVTFEVFASLQAYNKAKGISGIQSDGTYVSGSTGLAYTTKVEWIATETPAYNLANLISGQFPDGSYISATNGIYYQAWWDYWTAEGAYSGG
jgi:predicted phage tail protein